MKRCLIGNPTTHIDQRQITGSKANQLIQFATEVGLEMPSAISGMLEDLLLKINSKTGRGGGGEDVCLQSPFPSKYGSTVAESVASRSLYSLPTITESIAISPLTDF